MLIPDYQRFTCSRCGLLCRRLFIPLAPYERERIESLTGESLNVVSKGGTMYLPRDQEGRCIFLAEDNLCRIHARYGPDAKPLACRAFPYTFSRVGDRVAVGVRFACPAVAANEGAALASESKALKRWAAEIEEKTSGLKASETGWRGMSWTAVEGIVQIFSKIFRAEELPWDRRVLVSLRLFQVVERAETEELELKATLPRLDRLREALIREEGEMDTKAVGEPTGPERGLFFQILAHYARRDEERPDSWSLKARLRRSLDMAKVMSGKGRLSLLSQDLPGVGWKDLLRVGFVMSPSAVEPASRFVRMKLDTHQFYGPSHHGFELDEGFRSLCVAAVAIGAFARASAKGEDRPEISRGDVARAVSAVDHGFSYMAGFRSSHLRKIVRRLSQEDVLRRISRAYGLG